MGGGGRGRDRDRERRRDRTREREGHLHLLSQWLLAAGSYTVILIFYSTSHFFFKPYLLCWHTPGNWIFLHVTETVYRTGVLRIYKSSCATSSDSPDRAWAHQHPGQRLQALKHPGQRPQAFQHPGQRLQTLKHPGQRPQAFQHPGQRAQAFANVDIKEGTTGGELQELNSGSSQEITCWRENMKNHFRLDFNHFYWAFKTMVKITPCD